MWNYDDLERIIANQLSLEISSMVQQEAREKSQCHSSRVAQFGAYLNRVCLYTFVNYLNDSFAQVQPVIFLGEDGLFEVLEVMNGCAIDLGRRRVVIIPCEISDFDCLCVPQEWIDIPSFAGDYYLAVTVDLEAVGSVSTMKVEGFATHRQIKQFASFNDTERVYNLAVDELIQSLTVMDITWEMQLRAEIAELPSLSTDEANNLLNILGNKEIISPRLRVDIPFTQWGALLANDVLRRQLYTRRVKNFTSSKNNLNQWLNNIFDVGWQSLDNIFITESRFAFNFRQREYAIRDFSVAGVKLIDLGMELGNKSLALLVGVMPVANEVAVRVQLHSVNGDTYLPPNVKLALLSTSGTTLQECSSRIQDNFIQLKRFTCPQGTAFRIRVAMNSFSFTEDFVIEPLITNYG